MTLPTYVGASASMAAINAGNATPALPSGWQEGDLLLILCESANQAVSAPSGWTEALGSPQFVGASGATTATRLTIFERIATSSETAPAVASPGNHLCCYMIAIRNTDGTPVIAHAGGGNATGTSSLSLPAVTTDTADNLILNALAIGRDIGSFASISGESNANLASLTERLDATNAIGSGGGIGLYTGNLATPANTGNTTCTLATTDACAFITLAIEPPAGGATENGAASWSASGDATITSRAVRRCAIALDAAATMEAGGARVVRADLSWTAVASFTIAPTILRAGSINLSAEASFLATPDGTSTEPASASFSAAGDMGIRGSRRTSASATLSAEGSIGIEARSQVAASLAVTAAGSLHASSTIVAQSSVELHGTSNLGAQGRKLKSTSLAMDSTGAFAARAGPSLSLPPSSRRTASSSISTPRSAGTAHRDRTVTSRHISRAA